MSTRIDELKKAIQEAAGTGESLLKKSQMGFDFTPGPNPHHAAYARRNASGTVSQIQAKGAPTPEHHAMVKELHDAFEKHDRRGRGGMGISTDHPDYSTPEKYLQTAKNILIYRGHDRLGAKGRDEVAGIIGRHIKQLEPQGHDEQPVTVQAATAGRTHAIPQRHTYPAPSRMTTADLQKIIESREAHTEDFIGDLKAGDKTELVWSGGQKQEITIKGAAAAPSAAVKSLIAQVETAAANLMANPGMEAHRPEVDQMISELHKFPSAGHASAIVGRLVDMDLEIKEAEGAPAQSDRDKTVAFAKEIQTKLNEFGLHDAGVYVVQHGTQKPEVKVTVGDWDTVPAQKWNEWWTRHQGDIEINTSASVSMGKENTTVIQRGDHDHIK